MHGSKSMKWFYLNILGVIRKNIFNCNTIMETYLPKTNESNIKVSYYHVCTTTIKYDFQDYSDKK